MLILTASFDGWTSPLLDLTAGVGSAPCVEVPKEDLNPDPPVRLYMLLATNLTDPNQPQQESIL